MPTARSDRRPLRGAVVALSCLLVLAACSDDAGPAPTDRSATGKKHRDRPPAVESIRAPDVVRSLNRSLDRRVEAVLEVDRDRFLADVSPDLQAAQATYFDNLAALPLADLDLYADPRTLVREGDDYWVEVEVALQLDGYDAVPVRTRDRYLFTRAGGRTLQLASTTDETWEADHDVRQQPWDAGPLTVVEGRHVLGLFDAGSAGQARRVVGDAERAVEAVAAAVPDGWDRRVVVYALSDPWFLESVDGVPGDDPLGLDAVAFPVFGAGDDLASTRVVLNPATIARPGPERDRLLRHELTHVALGADQDGVPTWLVEGLAEYVSVRPLASEERTLSGAAIEAAEEGLDALPAEEDFRGDRRAASYGISWWVCEAIAETYDEGMLWVLLDAMGGPEVPEDVLRRVLGLREVQLARKAGRLLLATYRGEEPEDDRSDRPSDAPTDEATDEPSDEPSDEAPADDAED